MTGTLTVGSMPGGFSGVVSTNTLPLVQLIVTSGGGSPFTTWQNQYFGCTACAQAQPGADPFGKGMSNTNQFLAGFDPTNKTAYVHITAIAKVNSGVDVSVTYLGASGNTIAPPNYTSRTNVLEFTAGTISGNYSSNNFASTGVTNILSGGTGAGTLTNMVDPGGATNRAGALLPRPRPGTLIDCRPRALTRRWFRKGRPVIQRDALLLSAAHLVEAVFPAPAGSRERDNRDSQLCAGLLTAHSCRPKVSILYAHHFPLCKRLFANTDKLDILNLLRLRYLPNRIMTQNAT